MINSVELKNFGPIEQLDWKNLGKINLVIGNNDCGKSFLLKALYAAIRTLEDYKRGDNPDSLKEILVEKLYWTFQGENGIIDLPTKSNDAALSFNLTLDEKSFSYDYYEDSLETNDVASMENKLVPRLNNSIFLPAKEVLSVYHLILQSRQQNKRFGFDDTYLDLAIALQTPPSDVVNPCKEEIFRLLPQDCNSEIFNQVRNMVRDIIGGKVEFNDVTKRWYFKKGEHIFSMGETAEGIKKIAILDTLLGNGYLSENSIIFIDEPESNLHPEMISKLLDIVAILANHGIQFFIASHSYFVINKLFLIAQEQKLSIPILSKEGDNWHQSDLLDDMPDNAIIDESIRLYKEEMGLAFK